MTQLSRLGLAALVFLLGLSGLVMAEDNPSRAQTNRDIRVEPGQKVGDLSCINCSIYIRGEVAGDVFALHGNVVIDGGASVAGDIATLFGNIRVANGGSVAGDVAAIGGAVRRQPQAAIAGDVTSLEGMAPAVAALSAGDCGIDDRPDRVAGASLPQAPDGRCRGVAVDTDLSTDQATID
jgi:hypothetical protein